MEASYVAVNVLLLSSVAPERDAVESALKAEEWCFCTIRVVPWIIFTPRCVVALYFFVNYFLYRKECFSYEMDGFKRNPRKVSRIF